MTSNPRAQRSQAGMALVAALFLIVVLAGIGIYAARIGGAQQTGVDATLMAARAEAAALTGLEYQRDQAIHHLVPSGCPAPPPPGFTSGGLGGFSISLTCVAGLVTAGPPARHVFTITATATSGTYGTANYASRTLRAVVTDTP